MPNIQEEILKVFCQKLAASDCFNDAIVRQLRDLFEANKKPKAADLVRVFSSGSEEDLP